MNRIISIVATLCLASSACRDEEGAASGDTLQVYPSDEDILAMAYDNTYTVPERFILDERAETTGSYTIYHVKDESISYELCSYDYAEASASESADNESRSVNGVYVGSYENNRYFEFIRDLDYSGSIGNITDPTSPGFSRVFKCSYINRVGVDRNVRDGYAGTLSVRPLTEEVIRDFTEYMWRFTFFWPAEKTVLESYSDEQTDAYRHTLLLAFVTNQGFSECDLIEVVNWVFTVEKNNGQVTKEFVPLYEFEAQLINGLPERCD